MDNPSIDVKDTNIDRNPPSRDNTNDQSQETNHQGIDANKPSQDLNDPSQDAHFPSIDDLSLVVLDLDGTVICPFGKEPIAERTRRAIGELLKQGLSVAFATGRTEDHASKVAPVLGVSAPMVTYNGGHLYCPIRQELLFQARVDKDLAIELYEWLEGEGEVVVAYLETDSGLRLIQSRCSGDPSYDDHLYGTPRHLTADARQEMAKANVVSKLIVATERQLPQEIEERFGPVVQAVRTHPALVEVLPLGVSKGSGVLRLCRHLGVDPGRVLAVGDQENDISMFEVCGYSVAMGDAPETVKQKASFTTGSFSEHGCAQALERLLRKG